jgi:hypothetical protein
MLLCHQHGRSLRHPSMPAALPHLLLEAQVHHAVSLVKR